MIFNIKLFYFSSILICVYLQLNYFKKIFKLLKIKYVYFLIIFYAVNVTPFFTLFFSDVVKTFFFYSLIFYYYLKYSIKKNKKDFFKLTLFSSYLFLNVHQTSFTILLSALVLMFFLNKQFYLFKKKYFYFSFILFLLITSEEIYRVIVQYLLFSDIERAQVVDLDLKHFFSGMAFFLKFIQDYFNIDIPFVSPFKPYDNFYLAFTGVVFYFSFFYSIYLFIKKQSFKLYYLNILLILFSFAALFDPRIIFFTIVSANVLLFDIVNFCSIILFGHLLSSIKKIKSTLIIIFSFIFISIFYFQNIHYKHKNHYPRSNLKINKKYEDSEFYNYFKNFKNNNFSKVYLSPSIWKSFDEGTEYDFFLDGNVFNPVDLIEYNLYPFNSIFKLSSKIPLRMPIDKFYSEIDSRYSDINNSNFLNTFHIQYLFITEEESKFTNLDGYKLLKSFNSQNEKINFYQLKTVNKMTIKDTNINLVKKCIDKEVVYCLIDNMDPIDNEFINMSRKGLNKYDISNKSNKKLNFILPFLHDKSWKIKNAKIYEIKDSLSYIILLPNQKVSIYYRDDTRIFLKLISVLTFVFLSFFVLRKNA